MLRTDDSSDEGDRPLRLGPPPAPAGDPGIGAGALALETKWYFNRLGIYRYIPQSLPMPKKCQAIIDTLSPLSKTSLSDPDKSATIYRRFDKLSARNLLYLEPKLGILESEQERLDEEDGTTFDLKSAAISWEEFEEQAKQPDKPEVRKRMKLATEITEALRTYRKCRTFTVSPCMRTENIFRRGSVLV